MNDSVNNAKKEMKKNEEKYSLQEITIIDNIDNNSIINSFNIILVLFSWIGVIAIIIFMIDWIINIIK